MSRRGGGKGNGESAFAPETSRKVNDTLTEEVLSRTFIVGNKDIFVDLKRNAYGVYIKIAERTSSSRNTIVIPSGGIRDFKRIIDEFSQMTQVMNPIAGAGLPESASPVAPASNIFSHVKKDQAAKSVFVIGLNNNTTKNELWSYFSKVGTVDDADVITKAKKTCGYVTYNNIADVDTAIVTLSNSILSEVTIKVTKFKPSENDAKSTVAAPVVRTGRSKEDGVPDPYKIHIAGLVWEATDQDLSSFFGNVGVVSSATVKRTKSGRSLGTAIVTFVNESSVDVAIARFHNSEFKGRKITVRNYITYDE